MTEQQFEKAVRLMVNGDKAGLREIYEIILDIFTALFMRSCSPKKMQKM